MYMYACASAEGQLPLYEWRKNLEDEEQASSLLIKREALQRAMTLMTHLQLNAQVHPIMFLYVNFIYNIIIYTLLFFNQETCDSRNL